MRYCARITFSEYIKIKLHSLKSETTCSENFFILIFVNILSRFYFVLMYCKALMIVEAILPSHASFRTFE